VLVGAGAALEAVAARFHGRDGKDVCAVGADFWEMLAGGSWRRVCGTYRAASWEVLAV
jgi:hypothetical protein